MIAPFFGSNRAAPPRTAAAARRRPASGAARAEGGALVPGLPLVLGDVPLVLKLLVPRLRRFENARSWVGFSWRPQAAPEFAAAGQHEGTSPPGRGGRPRPTAQRNGRAGRLPPERWLPTRPGSGSRLTALQRGLFAALSRLASQEHELQSRDDHEQHEWAQGAFRRRRRSPADAALDCRCRSRTRPAPGRCRRTVPSSASAACAFRRRAPWHRTGLMPCVLSSLK